MVNPEQHTTHQPTSSFPPGPFPTPGRPPGWPPWMPWPPGSTGPTFPIAAPGTTFHETGIRWYEVGLSTEVAMVSVVAFDGEGREHSKLTVNFCRERELRWVISSAPQRVSGHLAVSEPRNGEVVGRGEVAGQPLVIRMPVEGGDADLKVDASPCLPPEQGRLILQWGRLAEPLVVSGQAMDLRQGQGVAQGGCAGCLVSGAGLVVGSAACGLTLGLGCVAVGIGFVGFAMNCTGACA